jgi:hypothetical protein
MSCQDGQFNFSIIAEGNMEKVEHILRTQFGTHVHDIRVDGDQIAATILGIDGWRAEHTDAFTELYLAGEIKSYRYWSLGHTS